MAKDPCVGCGGGLHCLNENSPCYMYQCGEYPGTGPKSEEEPEEEPEEKPE